VGFEPTDGGFADLSLRPLGYRAGCKEYNETPMELSVVYGTSEFEQIECASTFLLPKVRARTLAAHFEGVGTTWASRMNRADSSGGVGQI
jgi:hypothetical protein